MRSALRGPAHQLAVRMRINNCTHGHNNYCPINQPCHAPATALAPRVCTLVPFIIHAIIYKDRSGDFDKINNHLCWGMHSIRILGTKELLFVIIFTVLLKQNFAVYS